MMQFVRLWFFSVVFCVLPALQGTGQNVSNYPLIPDPFLFLLREPAVLDDLNLNADQRVQLTQLNDRIDGPLLMSRNWPTEQARQKQRELKSTTSQRVAEILNDRQRERIEQITRRARGIKFVAMPEVAEQLEISADQRERIDEILRQTRRELRSLRNQDQTDATPTPAAHAARQLREDEQKEILRELSAEQRKRLVAMVGPMFDLSRLGQVSFKAPEVLESGGWINTQPLTLADLQGKVVALHFFACA